jgi:hypothetical protein
MRRISPLQNFVLFSFFLFSFFLYAFLIHFKVCVCPITLPLSFVYVCLFSSSPLCSSLCLSLFPPVCLTLPSVNLVYLEASLLAWCVLFVAIERKTTNLQSEEQCWRSAILFALCSAGLLCGLIGRRVWSAAPLIDPQPHAEPRTSLVSPCLTAVIVRS